VFEFPKGDRLKEVAVGSMITGLLFVVSVFTPIFGFIAAVFIPSPVLYYRLKLGRALGVWIPAVSGIFMLLLLGNEVLSIVFFMELLVLGILIGEGLSKGRSLEWTYGFSTLILCGAGFMVTLIAAQSAGIGIGAWLSNYVEENLKLTLAIYKSAGMSESSIALMAQQLDKIRMVLVRILPGFAVCSMLFTIWVNMLVIRRVLAVKRVLLPIFEDALNQWRAPEIWVWAVIGSGMGLLIPVGWIKIFCLNCLLVFMCIYFFQGMAIVAYFFEKRKLPKGFRILLYMLIVIQQLMLLVVIGIGFFDVWINFRKLGNSRTD
jgi:uncharacterized protein YybS (DUF2232 family)